MTRQIIQHLRTNVKDKKPTSSDILNGEIAVNYTADGETLYIKNSNDEIVEFKDKKYIDSKISSCVEAVETQDTVDDVNVDYATKAYVDGLVGDINSVLESIILFPITINFNNSDKNKLRQVCNFLIKKYGTSYGSQTSPLNVSEEIYLQEFSTIGDGQVKFMSIFNEYNMNTILLYLDDYKSTGFCCRIQVVTDDYIRVNDYFWD